MHNILSQLNLSPEEFWSIPKDDLVSLLVSIGIPKSEVISKPRGCWFSNITEHLDYSRPEDWDNWTTEQQYAYVKQHGFSPETMMPASTSDSHKMFLDYQSPEWNSTTVHSDSERYFRYIIIEGEYIIQNCRNTNYKKMVERLPRLHAIMIYGASYLTRSVKSGSFNWGPQAAATNAATG